MLIRNNQLLFFEWKLLSSSQSPSGYNWHLGHILLESLGVQREFFMIKFRESLAHVNNIVKYYLSDRPFGLQDFVLRNLPGNSIFYHFTTSAEQKWQTRHRKGSLVATWNVPPEAACFTCFLSLAGFPCFRTGFPPIKPFGVSHSISGLAFSSSQSVQDVFWRNENLSFSRSSGLSLVSFNF